MAVQLPTSRAGTARSNVNARTRENRVALILHLFYLVKYDDHNAAGT